MPQSHNCKNVVQLYGFYFNVVLIKLIICGNAHNKHFVFICYNYIILHVIPNICYIIYINTTVRVAVEYLLL